MIADTTRDVITVTSNTGKYPPTYGDLFPYVIERGGTSPDGVEMESSGPWPVRNIHTPAGDEVISEACKMFGVPDIHDERIFRAETSFPTGYFKSFTQDSASCFEDGQLCSPSMR